MRELPFAAHVGYGAARRALLCTLVDPLLPGLLLSGPPGTGKSSLLRALGRFVREALDPEMPFLRLPFGADERALLGGVDLEQALLNGEAAPGPGLLARADGGYLIVDDIHRLPPHLASLLTGPLDEGIVRCEREGISRVDPARFALLATANPADGEIPSALLDRLPFLLARERRLPAEGALELARLQCELESGTMTPAWRQGERLLAERVMTARLRLETTSVGEPARRQLIEKGVELGVRSSRADLFALRAARAHAALRGAPSVEERDVTFAVATVLVPRSSTETQGEEQEQEGERPSPPVVGDEGEERRGGGSTARDTAAADDAQPQDRTAGGAAGGGDPGESNERTFEGIDFDAELPSLERFVTRQDGERGKGEGGRRGERRGRRLRTGEREIGGIAIGATLRAAAPEQRRREPPRGRALQVTPEDLRFHEHQRRSGTLFIFCVDASGSMAANRMREAKGGVTRLLQQAYVDRDRVALIAFRGAEAELLLPPTGSIERAKRSLDVLPTGGGTPLASALMRALALVQQERRRGNERALVVILTDGRGNVPVNETAASMIMEERRRQVREELERIGLAWRRAGIESLVIDTRPRFIEGSEAVRLAALLGGGYHHLPDPRGEDLARLVRPAGG